MLMLVIVLMIDTPPETITITIRSLLAFIRCFYVNPVGWS